MAELDQIEKRLRESLVPRGFTDRGVRDLEALIDDLAGVPAASADSAGAGRSTIMLALTRWGAVAAAITGAAILVWRNVPELPEPVATFQQVSPAVQLVSTSEGVVSAEREGDWLTDEDGSLLQGWHVQVVNEERFHDVETGETVRVLNPREELVMLPVSTF